MLGTGVMSWHNQGTLMTSLLWYSAWVVASALNLVSEMLSNEPGYVSYSKLVRLDVVRCPRLNRQGVIESRAMGLWSYLIPDGGKRMTLIELSINMAKTAPAKRVHSTLTGRSAVFFRRRKMKISPRGLPIIPSITMAVIP